MGVKSSGRRGSNNIQGISISIPFGVATKDFYLKVIFSY